VLNAVSVSKTSGDTVPDMGSTLGITQRTQGE
jgi:hypothetical protein